MIKTAADLNIGEDGYIKELNIENSVQRQRLMDLGYLPNTQIYCYTKAYGISAYKLKDSLFAIRDYDAKHIILK